MKVIISATALSTTAISTTKQSTRGLRLKCPQPQFEKDSISLGPLVKLTTVQPASSGACGLCFLFGRNCAGWRCPSF